MIIFELPLATFEASSIYEVGGAAREIDLCLKPNQVKLFQILIFTVGLVTKSTALPTTSTPS